MAKPHNHDCVFCRIIKGRLPSYIIDETKDVIVFVSMEGHPLVVPKKHIKDIYSMDDINGGLLMVEIVKISKAIKKGLDCDGVYIAQANESAAGQDVFHIHFHLFPMWIGKKRMDKTVSDKYRRMIMQKIKSVL